MWPIQIDQPEVITESDPTKAANLAQYTVGPRFGSVTLAPLGTDGWARLAAIVASVGTTYPIILMPGNWTFTANTAFLLRAVSGSGHKLIPASAGAVTLTEEMIYVADIAAEAWTPRCSTRLPTCSLDARRRVLVSSTYTFQRVDIGI